MTEKVAWELRYSQEQFVFDLWQAESAEERCRLLQTHADQVNANLIATLHTYANEASKMGGHHTAWDLMAISQEVPQYLGVPKLIGRLSLPGWSLALSSGQSQPRSPVLEDETQ